MKHVDNFWDILDVTFMASGTIEIITLIKGFLDVTFVASGKIEIIILIKGFLDVYLHGVGIVSAYIDVGVDHVEKDWNFK